MHDEAVGLILPLLTSLRVLETVLTHHPALARLSHLTALRLHTPYNEEGVAMQYGVVDFARHLPSLKTLGLVDFQCTSLVAPAVAFWLDMCSVSRLRPLFDLTKCTGLERLMLRVRGELVLLMPRLPAKPWQAFVQPCGTGKLTLGPGVPALVQHHDVKAARQCHSRGKLGVRGRECVHSDMLFCTSTCAE